MCDSQDATKYTPSIWRALNMSGFRVAARSVIPLRNPSDFYQCLLEQTARAQRQVTLAALYLGTGHLERQLASALVTRHADLLSERGHEPGSAGLDALVQMDYSRAQRLARGDANSQYLSSAHLLMDMQRCMPTAQAPLVPGPVDHPVTGQSARLASCGGLQVGLTLMPQLRGAWGRLLPPRFVEGVSVFHVKAYAFDDSVLLSGANLSADYFTNRADRYVLFEGVPAFAAYVHALMRAVHHLPGGHVLRPTGELQLTPPADPSWRAWCDTASGLLAGEQPSAATEPAAGDAAQAAQVAAAVGANVQAQGATQQQNPATAAGAFGHALPSLDPGRVTRHVPIPQAPTAKHNLAFRQALRHVCDACSVAPEGRRASGGAGDATSALSKARDAADAPPHRTAGAADGPAAGPASSGASGWATLRPRMQCGALGARRDEEATAALLAAVGNAPAPAREQSASPVSEKRPAAAVAAARAVGDDHQASPQASAQECGESLHLATGYFNLPARYMRALLQQASPAVPTHILTAAPQANGFYQSAGISGALPLAYSEAERAFYSAAAAAGRLHPDPLGRLSASDAAAAAAAGSPSAAGGGIALYEYCKPGWTFHGKGLWWERRAAAQPAAAEPSATPAAAVWHVTSLVGSPNYGERSLRRDLELNVQIDTQDAELVGRLRRERDSMWGGLAQSVPPRSLAGTVDCSTDGHGDAGTGDDSVTVVPVGDHLPTAAYPGADVWRAGGERRLSGLWDWQRGWWIAVVRRLIVALL